MLAIRYGVKMEIRDILRTNLQLVVAMLGSISVLADKCESGSVKYFEQILTGFKGKRDKNPRSLGPSVAAAVAKTVDKPAQWMYEEHPELWTKFKVFGNVLYVNEPAAPTYLAAKSERDIAIDRIVALLKKTDDRGIAIILDKAKDIASEYSISKKTA